MIRLRSAWWKALAKLRLRSAISFGDNAVLLRPKILKVERGGRIVIEAGAVIEPGARFIVRGATLTIGRAAYVGTDATIVAFADTSIGAETLLGERVSVHSEDHGPRGRRDQFVTAPVRIGESCWICAGAVITKGVTIGDGSTIGANAVVTRPIDAGVLAVGAPARAIRPLS